MDLKADDWMRAEESTGTSIMAVAFDGGVVLGADSRVTTGAYISNRVADKITPLADKIVCCRSGSAADTQGLADYVRYFLDFHQLELGAEPAVRTAATMFRTLMYHNKFLLASIIVGGWDPKHGGQVFALPRGGSLVPLPFAVGGSGAGYVYGYCDAHYSPAMTRPQCRKFVVDALSLAMARDGSSGGSIRLCIIDQNGPAREFLPANKLPQFWQG